MDASPRRSVWIAVCVLAAIALLFLGYRFLLSPPSDFPEGGVQVIIPEGASAPQALQILSDERVIAHPEVLRTVLRVSGASSGVQAGIYLFKEPRNLLAVGYRIVAGEYGIPPVRITFIEGVTVRESARLVGDAFPLITEAQYSAAAKPYEGYLFPDTYLFQPSVNAEIVVAAQRDTFNEKIAPLMDDITASGRSLSDVVILASLVEKEARTTANKRIVAGILWNRLERDMPLQVDAVFGYIFNRPTYSPSYEDLKVESPYNTYKYRGLPPGPINNPGLDSLEAAIYPTKTKYLYYLTGNDDQMHYAATYTEHLANQRKYLP